MLQAHLRQLEMKNPELVHAMETFQLKKERNKNVDVGADQELEAMLGSGRPVIEEEWVGGAPGTSADVVLLFVPAVAEQLRCVHMPSV